MPLSPSPPPPTSNRRFESVICCRGGGGGGSIADLYLDALRKVQEAVEEGVQDYKYLLIENGNLIHWLKSRRSTNDASSIDLKMCTQEEVPSTSTTSNT